MNKKTCLIVLLSRLMRGSTALVLPEADSGSHFLYFSTGTQKILLDIFSSTIQRMYHSLTVHIQKNNLN